ncbi:MAG: type II toxin-antitoxin system VapB family antitoxin [Verrucomicrobiae bacterium]|nr:type II toxin-antitoxin system VapB family antitoxin [Verrucomicrobiae bacterium]MCP5539709.1 type II toxin-antitoxin system VapB family antitoxin [Akkermansiaceae bacterium]MCP5549446.1 type II toxin-antitoxin system VapB family antitoxin [Akkermansiaceae bacterium]
MKRTNIVLDEKLLSKAKKITGLRTQREIVDHALRELVRRFELRQLLELEGAIEWEGDLSEMRQARDL